MNNARKIMVTDLITKTAWFAPWAGMFVTVFVFIEAGLDGDLRSIHSSEVPAILGFLFLPVTAGFIVRSTLNWLAAFINAGEPA